jgi:acid phosphatase
MPWRPTRVRRAVLLATVLVALLAGCALQSTAHESGPSADRNGVAKLLVFVVENHSLRQMRTGMPWLNGLAQKYGYASRYRAVTHPSLPNYLAIASGSTHGVADDEIPARHPLTQPSVFGEAVKAHATARIYAEGMTSPCQQDDTGRYAVRHNPWTYFTSERQLCLRDDVPLDALAPDVESGRLPQVGMVIPDVCNDAHDCSLSQADTWLEQQVGLVLGGPDFTSGRLAVVVTADEDDYHHGNRVLTVIAHRSLHHQVVRTRLSHWSLSRAYAAVAGVSPLGHARRTTPLLTSFGLHAEDASTAG